MTSKWINVKDEMPPFDEFVEVYFGDDNYRELRRGFAAYTHIEDKIMWTTLGMFEDEWSDKGYNITHWKEMDLDPKGKKGYLILDRHNFVKAVLKKVV